MISNRIYYRFKPYIPWSLRMTARRFLARRQRLFNADEQSLIIFDNDGAPNLLALAQLLQRLYPEKLPLGFVYAETCDKSRAGGFGGGFFAIGRETIVNQSLAEVLEAEIAELGETPDA